MELTGKTLTDFRKWLILSDLREQIEIFCKLKINDTISEAFFELPEALKYGVYVDFFDSVGIDVLVYSDDSTNLEWKMWKVNGSYPHPCKTRPEARTESIKKANEIYNKM